MRHALHDKCVPLFLHHSAYSYGSKLFFAGSVISWSLFCVGRTWVICKDKWWFLLPEHHIKEQIWKKNWHGTGTGLLILIRSVAVSVVVAMPTDLYFKKLAKKEKVLCDKWSSLWVMQLNVFRLSRYMWKKLGISLLYQNYLKQIKTG